MVLLTEPTKFLEIGKSITWSAMESLCVWNTNTGDKSCLALTDYNKYVQSHKKWRQSDLEWCYVRSYFVGHKKKKLRVKGRSVLH